MLITPKGKKQFFRFQNIYFGLCLLFYSCTKEILPTIEAPTSTGTWTIDGKTYQAKSNKVTGNSVVWFDILNGQLNPQSPANTLTITFTKALPTTAGRFDIGILASDTSSDLPNSAAIFAINNANSQNEVSFVSPTIVDSIQASGEVQVRGSKRYISMNDIKIYQLGKNSSDIVDSTIVHVDQLEY